MTRHIDQEAIETPVERPVRNIANRPLVAILHNLALSFEAFPRAILELARAIQEDPAPVHDLHRKRLGDVVQEAANGILAYANEIKGSA